MCGIYAQFITEGKIPHDTYQQFKKLKHRGPDATSTLEFSHKFGDQEWDMFMGFHRLAIVGIHNGMQPFALNDSMYCLVNGEIYNYRELIKDYELPVKSQSDCEVVLHLYHKFGKEFVQYLDGVFSIIILDNEKGMVYFARDPIGVRPLFYHHLSGNLILSSEMKTHPDLLSQVFPGKLYSLDLNNQTMVIEPYCEITPSPIEIREKYETIKIKKLLEMAVIKRLPEETDVGFLLSGGLDSSLVLSIALEYYYEYYPEKLPIKCFSIGFDEKSPDLIGAKKVVEFLSKKYGPGALQHEIFITDTKSGIEVIPDIITTLESFDTTTIRASTPMYLLLEYIHKKHKSIKVILSGEGADELFGGYLYFHYAPSTKEFYDECHRLVKDLYFYDVLRADRTTAVNELELRVPFLDFNMIHYAMSYDFHKPGKKEKYVLRDAFEGYLPNEILWGQKEAFSDGCGYNWLDDLRKYAVETYGDADAKAQNCYPEEIMFRHIFDNIYPKRRVLKPVIPYIWLPKWINTKESSARFLNLHQTQTSSV